MDKIKKFMRGAWALACQGDPKAPQSCRVENGKFVFQIKGNRGKWESFCKAAGVPSHAAHHDKDDIGTWIWKSHADEFFGVDGPIAYELDNYEVRAPQLHMARMVQRAVEMRDVAFIEAGTGVGKGYAYLVPALTMDKKVVVSTSNKALQAQLMNKDLPFLMRFFPGKKFALVQGKKNYMCRAKCETLGEVSIFDTDLRNWYTSTPTGNIEEIAFTVDKVEQYTVDDYCTGKKCSAYHNCFYYTAKDLREDADVLVTNHAMLALNYLHPGANILPEAQLIVADEAHQTPEYARSMMADDLTFDAIQRAMTRASKHGAAIDDEVRSDFAEEIQSYIANSTDKQIGVNSEDGFRTGVSLAQELWVAADEVWDDADMANDPNELRLKVEAGKIRNVGNKVMAFSKPTQSGFVRWAENGDKISLINTPYDVSAFIGAIAGRGVLKAADPTQCCMCSQQLDGDWIYVSSNQQPCCLECIDEFDPMRWDVEEMPLAEWLAMDHDAADIHTEDDEATPMVFTSATIAAPNMDSFMSECGVKDAMQMIAASPFDYPNNTLLYVPNGNAPAPGNTQQATQRYRDHLVDEITRLIDASKGGALCLFTSYANMKYCHEALSYTLMDYTVLQQGDLPKMALLKQFAADGNAILFATKSFWEGVDVQGDPLRMVIIDKLPFESPKDPLVNAQSEHLRRWAAKQGITGSRLEWYPFNNMAIPHMIMHLKQGFGRLVRTSEDRGVVAILDPRVRTAQYGRKQILPSLPPAPLTDSMAKVQEFFADREKTPASSMEIFGLLASEEIPF